MTAKIFITKLILLCMQWVSISSLH